MFSVISHCQKHSNNLFISRGNIPIPSGGQKLTCLRCQVIIVSPEILYNDSRFEDLWNTKRFTDNLILDEAHVVKEWGGTFHSDYLQIGPIRHNETMTRLP